MYGTQGCHLRTKGKLKLTTEVFVITHRKKPPVYHHTFLQLEIPFSLNSQDQPPQHHFCIWKQTSQPKYNPHLERMPISFALCNTYTLQLPGLAVDLGLFGKHTCIFTYDGCARRALSEFCWAAAARSAARSLPGAFLSAMGLSEALNSASESNLSVVLWNKVSINSNLTFHNQWTLNAIVITKLYFEKFGSKTQQKLDKKINKKYTNINIFPNIP